MGLFNADGSLKLPGHMQDKINEKENKMKSQRCVLISKSIISDRSPKKCMLNIKLSQAISDNRFVETTYNYFKDKAEVPSKLVKVNDREFTVEIGTCFRRCSDCNSLVSRFRDFLDGNIIEEKGTCSYEGRAKNFSYEDYFD
jgi:fructose-1-phosphate kinase PfkB-like protein